MALGNAPRWADPTTTGIQSSAGPASHYTVDVNEVILSMSGMLQQLLGEDIQVVTNLDSLALTSRLIVVNSNR